MGRTAERLGRVLKLDSEVFRELADDTSATVPAIGISVLAGIIGGNILGGQFFLYGLGLFIWTGFVFAIGKLLGGSARYTQSLRPIGFAAAPWAAGIIALLPFESLAMLRIAYLGVVYSLVIQVLAIRAVGGVGYPRAVATILISLGFPLATALLLLAMTF